MKTFTFIALIATCSFFACKGDTKSQESNTQDQQTTVASESSPALPTLPVALQQKLFNEANYLDFIFHNFPFSMSQNEKQSIQMNVSYIANESVPEIPAACKSVARQFYQIDGEIVLEADVYYGDGCNFYVFFQDGKALYANQMTENGRTFFKNVIAQALEASKQVR